tara:strand:+ start:51 stop:626 length:576 start_codon:yes stop_codon:yes gene_type:complete
MKKLLIISGPIGAGKTVACKHLMSKGYKYINSDNLAKDIIRQSTLIHKKINILMSENIDFSQRIPWKKIRNFVFESKNNKLCYDNIIHPIFYKKLNKIIKYAKSDMVIEIPLIETIKSIKNEFIIITLLSRFNLRSERALKKNKIDKKSFEYINKFQMSNKFYISNSDYVIHNNSDIVMLKKRLNQILRKI